MPIARIDRRGPTLAPPTPRGARPYDRPLDPRLIPAHERAAPKQGPPPSTAGFDAWVRERYPAQSPDRRHAPPKPH